MRRSLCVCCGQPAAFGGANTTICLWGIVHGAAGLGGLERPVEARGRTGFVMPGTYDIDIHGVIRLRLVDATTDDVAKVRRQIGLPTNAATGDADIVIRFVERACTQPLTYVRVRECGFDANDFFVLRGTGGTPACASIPFDRIGACPEIVCERALPAVPHLVALINLTMLSKGVLPLHASAYVQDGRGVVVTGWAKGGKTECLLAAMDLGAEYVGDEWVYLTSDRTALGLPEPMRMWWWQLEQFPRLRGGRSGAQRATMAAWSRAASAAGRLSALRGPIAAIPRKAAPILGRQAYVQIPPAEIFGADRILLRGRVDALVLLASHTSNDIVTRPVLGQEIASRMAASLVDERVPLLDHYTQFRYAFPDRSSALVEQAGELERKLLAQTLVGLPSTSAFHPYPCDIAALGEAVHRACQDLWAS
jgi:hypothetical protein